MTQLTTTSQCTLWFSWNEGVQYTTLQNLGASDSAGIQCARWQQTYNSTGVLTVDLNSNLVTIANTPLNVNVLSIPTTTGTQLVALDSTYNNEVSLNPDFYPIPVINQGTSPQEVIFTGSTLAVSTELTQDSKDYLFSLSSEFYIVSLSTIITLVLFWKFLAPITRYFINKIW
jgi:hypothetical protein